MKEGRTFFYARVSTKQQKLERQEENFRRAYPDIQLIKEGKKKNLYEDKYTGTTNSREDWQKLRRRARKGDTIVFDSVSRMSRNATEGIETYMKLFDKGINLVFLKESTINTDVYRAELEKSLDMAKIANNQCNTVDNKDYIDTFISQLIQALTELFKNIAKAQIVKAFEQSEKEVMDLRQRTSEGVQRAMAKGNMPGQKKGTGARKATLKFAENKVLIIKLSKDFEGDMSDTEVMSQLRLSRNTYYKYKRLIKEEFDNLEKAEIEKLLKLKREDMRAYYQQEWNK